MGRGSEEDLHQLDQRQAQGHGPPGPGSRDRLRRWRRAHKIAPGAIPRQENWKVSLLSPSLLVLLVLYYNLQLKKLYGSSFLPCINHAGLEYNTVWMVQPFVFLCLGGSEYKKLAIFMTACIDKFKWCSTAVPPLILGNSGLEQH